VKIVSKWRIIVANALQVAWGWCIDAQ
jgi:hypothetical protein